MCCRLGNSHHCLTFLSVLGFLQALVGTPITVLSVLILLQGGLGYLLSPFWCGALLLITGGVALCIRPTRLAIVIGLHLLLNTFAIVTCIGAGGLSGLYGVSVLLPGYDTLLISGGDVVNTTITNGTTVVPCILSQNSRLFPENIRTVIQPLDDFVPNCSQLAHYWTFLVANMSLCFLGLLLSVVAIFTNCATPCLEDRYQRKWSPQTDA